MMIAPGHGHIQMMPLTRCFHHPPASISPIHFKRERTRPSKRDILEDLSGLRVIRFCTCGVFFPGDEP